jgi:hypothetical protein
VVAAFSAVAASGWLWAQAPKRSAASPAPAHWPATAARTAVPQPARGCCPGPSDDPECGSTVRGPADWAAPALAGCGAGADPQPEQLPVDQDIPVQAGETFHQLPCLSLRAAAAPSTEYAQAAVWRPDSVYPPGQHGCAWPMGVQLAPRWEALAQHPAVGPASTIRPHSIAAVTAAHRAFHRRPIAAFCPTQRLPGVPLPGTDG